MKNVAKEHRKRNKQMEKPQYSDASYFGHKRKPRIRKQGKRKMCKECGIVH
jgi:RNase P subunit RPR2